MSFRTCVVVAACALSASTALAQTDSSPDTTASIHYKGLTLTPVGFVAAEAAYRSRTEIADIGSSFNAIPFDGTSNYYLNEFRGTARQSRFGVLASGNAGSTKLTGFFEADFLGAGTSSNSNESNSYVFRVRQFWGQAKLDGGWTLSAGQMWSLITTDKQGMDNRAEQIPMTIDAQYSVGFNWARQFGLRLTKTLTKGVWLGVAAEGSQTTYTNHGAPGNVLLGGTGGSLLNSTQNYSADPYPDVLAKLAIEPGFGHYEIKVVGSAFRDRIVVPDTATSSRNFGTMGGGVGASANWSVKSANRSLVDFGVSGLWGRGIGRYGSGQLADATVRPDGAIVPLRAMQGLVSLEIHPVAQLDIYGYGGAEYTYRNAYVTGAGAGAGFGSPLLSNAGCTSEGMPTGPYTPASGGACNADTRALYQGNVGFWYRFYKGSAGTFAWGLQYSYTSRNTWSGLNGIQPNAIDNMGFLSIRYYIP